MTKQKIFEKAAKHLFRQGERSVEAGDVCRYRGRGGMKCVVGVFIPDDRYSPVLEGRDVSDLLRHHPNVLPRALKPHEGMLIRLQGLHDSPHHWYSSEAMRRQLQFIGASYNLNTAFLDSLWFDKDAPPSTWPWRRVENAIRALGFSVSTTGFGPERKVTWTARDGTVCSYFTEDREDAYNTAVFESKNPPCDTPASF